MNHSAASVLLALAVAALATPACTVIRADRALLRPGEDTGTGYCCRGTALVPTACVPFTAQVDACADAPVTCRDYVQCSNDVEECVYCVGRDPDGRVSSSVCGPGSGPPTWTLDTSTD